MRTKTECTCAFVGRLVSITKAQERDNVIHLHASGSLFKGHPFCVGSHTQSEDQNVDVLRAHELQGIVDPPSAQDSARSQHGMHLPQAAYPLMLNTAATQHTIANRVVHVCIV